MCCILAGSRRHYQWLFSGVFPQRCAPAVKKEEWRTSGGHFSITRSSTFYGVSCKELLKNWLKNKSLKNWESKLKPKVRRTNNKIVFPSLSYFVYGTIYSFDNSQYHSFLKMLCNTKVPGKPNTMWKAVQILRVKILLKKIVEMQEENFGLLHCAYSWAKIPSKVIQG